MNSIRIFGIDSIENCALLDIASTMHVFAGIIFYIFLHKYLKISIINSFIIFNVIHLIYELKDYYFSYIKKYKGKRPPPSYDYFNIGYHANNSYLNSICDLVVGIIGFILAHYIIKLYGDKAIFILILISIILFTLLHKLN